jgi:hypothetical protein
LHPLLCIYRKIKSGKVLKGRACTIYWREEKGNTYKVLGREAEEKRPLGWDRHRWEDSTHIGLKQ